MISRRDFLHDLVGLAAVGAASGLVIASPRARAQSPGRIARIGVLTVGPSTVSPIIDGFMQGLRELGYVEGRNLRFEYRYSQSNVDEVAAQAAELVALKVDLIYALSSTQVEGARRATTTVPIVFAVHNDPVGTGHVASLGRPGGNITGMAQDASVLAAKQLELLREMIPKADRIAVLWNSTTPSHPPALKQVEAAARVLGIGLHRVDARDADEFERALADAVRAGDKALLVLTSPASYVSRARLVELLAKYRLPAMYQQKEFVLAGGLLSYGADYFEMARRSATYVDKILKGAKPADLPVEHASRFEFVINRKTATALGITLPQSILIRADMVIE